MFNFELVKNRNMKKIFLILATLLSQSTYANVLGDMQTFSPNTDGLDFVTVHTARPLPVKYWVFSNYLNYAQDHLLVYKSLAAQDRIDYRDSIFEYDLGLAYGWSENLQISFQMPVLLSHSSEEQEGVKVDIFEGIHTFRPGFKWSLPSGPATHWAFLGSIDFPFVDNSPYTGTEPYPIYNLEGAYSWSHKSRIQSLNAGFRARNPSSTPADAHMFPLRSQFIASYGISEKWSQTARWVFEVIGSLPVDKDPYKETTHASSIDVLLAMKHRWFKNLNFDWGGTIEPGVESLAPKYRVFAGLVYYWKPGEEAAPNKESEKPLETVFSVLPDSSTVKTMEFVQFYAEGDQQIESCQIVDGPGQISSACEYHSDTPGMAKIIFKDTFGRSLNRFVNVEEKSFGTVGFSKPVYKVYTGSSLQPMAVGGLPPYSFRKTQGEGNLSETGFFEAPLRPQKVDIEVQDQKGTTAQAAIEVVEPPKEDQAINLSNLEFVSGKAELTPNSMKILRSNLNSLRRVNIQSLIIEGHTDSIGADSYNQRLSRLRAEAVKKILSRELGIPVANVDAIGHGESKPIATNDNSAGRQRNRRVVLKVYYKK